VPRETRPRTRLRHGGPSPSPAPPSTLGIPAVTPLRRRPARPRPTRRPHELSTVRRHHDRHAAHRAGASGGDARGASPRRRQAGALPRPLATDVEPSIQPCRRCRAPPVVRTSHGVLTKAAPWPGQDADPPSASSEGWALPASTLAMPGSAGFRVWCLVFGPLVRCRRRFSNSIDS
jgi:hypothetical protein